MRCSEARHRLNGSRREGAPISEDQELKAHLAACPSCARLAESTLLMNSLLDGASVDDTEGMTPLTEQKRLVAARLAGRQSLVDRVRNRLAGLEYWGWRRPVYAVSLGFAVVLLALAAIVPFNYNKTTGYDVAFGGVCMDVATDDDKLCDMLHSLGLGEAAIDLEGCDSVCNLNIICLRSKEEVRLVVAALENMCPTGITTSVIPVVDRTSGSLLNRANEKVFRDGRGG